MVPKKKPDDSTYSGRFAIRLYELRKKAGLSAEQVAEVLGIPSATYYNWEASRNLPSIDKLPELAEILGVEIRTVLPKK